ncbi:unnamed protein product [Nezara viridula]|uniref:Uncharacterized protein n=1 Tax=Nezara viridula TaxID=85310 RepID=A0A9P0H4N0_NEZVI|nr:unnamed protein product [Nezara viridula]
MELPGRRTRINSKDRHCLAEGRDEDRDPAGSSGDVWRTSDLSQGLMPQTKLSEALILDWIIPPSFFTIHYPTSFG